MREYPNYTRLYTKELKDIANVGTVLRHRTGARVVLLENDDDNKVFTIGFRTPPENSTGVAHILEHSVLCGSERFPLKDPFVELVKGSLNTFLNAMTFPDKTIYPVASVNDKDFQNLMEVYLDAVFYPNVYRCKEIFMQEGWHYHLESEDATLMCNGVVYNEMKGVYSMPESELEKITMSTLLPDTQYGVSSGGDPDFIPDLSYEEFLDFHRTYYHPSNAWIILYGKMDFAEKLDYIDREYLSKFEPKEIESSIRTQVPFTEPRRVRFDFSVGEDLFQKNKAYYSWNTIVENNADVQLMTAMEVLCYALVNAPGSVVRKTMVGEGFASSVQATMEYSIRQPYFSIVAKECKVDAAEEFETMLERLLREELDGGLRKESLLAGINRMEFDFKEADYGSYPKGLYYMMYVFDGMLYDENDAFIYLEMGEVFRKLRDLVETDYFDKLAVKYILDNPFRAMVEGNPVPGLTLKRDMEMTKKLNAYKEQLTAEEKKALIEQTARLIEFQTKANTPEELATLPRLERSDLNPDIRPLSNLTETVDGVTFVRHDYETNGLIYPEVCIELDLNGMNLQELSLLMMVLGKLSTEHYTYQELADEISIHTGGISFGLKIIPTVQGDVRVFLRADAAAIGAKTDKIFDFLEEIFCRTDFSDTARLKELMLSRKATLESVMTGSGHVAAITRAKAGFSVNGYISEQIGSLSMYDWLGEQLENYEAIAEESAARLKTLFDAIKRRNRVTVSVTGTDADYETVKNRMTALAGQFPTADTAIAPFRPELKIVKEGIQLPARVQFVARAGNFVREGLEYHGYLKILQSILSYEYLWENVRVRGGAYGCMSAFPVSGDSYLVSYRDPKLLETEEVYERLPEWLDAFHATDEEMLKYIIGTLSNMDRPLTPRMAASSSFGSYLSGMTEEELQRYRDEVLSATDADIRGCADYIRAILKTGAFVVVGNEKKIEEVKDHFDRIRTL